ncbi:hypothetical protein BpHYR1_003648 [Brachionus plicatilis]|uniref:Uncharacterized protein n=1 Tax=Brachionus plicatilis TaxID=10195 RepID=A0A3M7QZ60_BRAPC|nr:hypothetical protein BpHYR1_003648 [Brachionus plicatilis]
MMKITLKNAEKPLKISRFNDVFSASISSEYYLTKLTPIMAIFRGNISLYYLNKFSIIFVKLKKLPIHPLAFEPLIYKNFII